LFVKGRLIAEGDVKSLSQQLFGDEPIIVQAGVQNIEEELQKAITEIKGVSSVRLENNTFHIGCTRDVTPVIAELIVQSGAGLTHLQKKEYGLDDIYNRYFEGGGA